MLELFGQTGNLGDSLEALLCRHPKIPQDFSNGLESIASVSVGGHESDNLLS